VGFGELGGLDRKFRECGGMTIELLREQLRNCEKFCFSSSSDPVKGAVECGRMRAPFKLEFSPPCTAGLRSPAGSFTSEDVLSNVYVRGNNA